MDYPPCHRCGALDWLPIPDSLAHACKKCGAVIVGYDGRYETGKSLQEWAADLHGLASRDASQDLASRDARHLEFPVVSDDPSVQAFYIEMRLEGQSHNMAELLALQQSPGSMGTDSSFWSGGMNSSAHWDRWPWPVRNFYMKRAKQYGVDTTGKVYMPTMARFPGDPQAWIASRSDIKRLAEERNWDVSGAVEHRCDESLMHELVAEQSPVVPIGQDILNREVFKECLRNPEKALNLEETKAEVTDRLTPHHKKTNSLTVI